MGRKKPTTRDEENPQPAGSKSKKKALVIEDDEYSIGTELSEESQVQEEKAAVTGKKGKKGNSKASQRRDEDLDDVGKVDEGDDEVPQVAFTGKKKGKSKKSGGNSVFSASSFGLLGDEDEGVEDDEKSGLTGDEEEDAPVVSFSGKKKASKSSKKTAGSLFTGSAFDVIGDEDDSDGEVVDDSEDKSKEDDENEPVIAITGKKKPSKGGKKVGSVFAAASFDALDDADEDKDEEKDADDDVPQITFSGKKKKSSKASKKSGGKKKSSKKKGNSAITASSEETKFGAENTDVVEPEQPSKETSKIEADDAKVNKSKEVPETSKSKKKKKKSGRTAQEEDDLDMILAELGEGSFASKPAAAPVKEEKVEVQPDIVAPVDGSGEKEGEEETVESAAAKKKKKKKDKEKEKKAAAAAAAAGTATASVAIEDEKLEENKIEPKESKKNEVKGKAADKKVPKHVREMQEALARRKEQEERKQREEEEKRRKEEEERLRLEELERQKEEARRKKKEREKEKLQKKRQEGKLLSAKQKEEARRLEAMRNQILANAANGSGSLPLPTTDNEKKAKRPLYQKKKSKAVPNHANGVAPVNPVESIEEEENQQDTVPELYSVEFDKVEEVESVDLEDKSEVAESVKENGVEEEEEEDDDEEWDAKSWDDAVVNLSLKSGFSDEEVDSEPEPVVRKDIKSAGSKLAVYPQRSVPSQPIKSQDAENKKKQPEIDADRSRKKEATAKKEAPSSDSATKEGEDNLRSPICCIMGHVDTGKTKLLDCIRGTNVQEGEAGGITQQIGATYFPAENIRERTKELKADAKLKVPGLLVIDTPGHESFTNLRSRGSGLCDIAILVVDIMHGLEPQTIESLNLLKMRNTEFIVALNKVDRLYGWKTCRNAPIVKAMKQQTKDVQNEFNMRLVQIITQFKEQGLNTELYYKNKEMGETYSIIPTSAISGEGIPDMLLLLVQWTQKTMVEKLTYSNEVQGPIVTSIRALLTPHPMKELRVKGTYLHHSEIKAAQGIKITAQGLEHAIAGTALYVVGPRDDLEEVKEAAMEDMKSVLNRIDKSGEGVCVQASTLGSLEALLEFLKTQNIGPVHKKDVMKASVMLEKKKEYATILAFDVKVTPEAREMADDLGVKIFIADIIYHLFDQFKAYIDNLKEEKKKESADEAVFPCVLKILPNCVFNKKDPIVLGVDVLEGIAKVGTPICIPQRDFITIGRIASIENNHKPVDIAKKGLKVAIKIVGTNSDEQQKMFGRHFEIEDELVSHISRRSIDILKSNYRDELSIDEWKLVVKLKKLFEIP
ncbi:eukaryotic translation initiation factor 2 family protein [Prunus dulcis]|uniref:Eukaryotic translation initiation factor 5B n=1 Tax=Prunus dulcis TaxID=3755 RepID=A0A4Y1RYM5_PRUDU|nr:eukaryotic translation initiation factor 2 family protein [Prunus dulcis]